MKTKIHLLGAMLLCCSTLLAQKPDTVIAKAFYKTYYIPDTNNRGNVYSENMILLLGKHASIFKSYDRMQFDSLQRASVNSGDGMTFRSNGSSTAATTENIFFFDSKKYFLRQQLVMNFIVPYDYPVIAWKIGSEKKTIEGLKCQKAIGAWKGRTYEVWFCPSLPFTSGPWKLNGLPGLIVSALDTKQEVGFKFQGFQKARSKELIALNKTDKLTTPDQLDKLRALSVEDPGLFAKSVLGIDLERRGEPRVRRKFKGPNNPMELVK